jgi:hypothetical protein
VQGKKGEKENVRRMMQGGERNEEIIHKRGGEKRGMANGHGGDKNRL